MKKLGGMMSQRISKSVVLGSILSAGCLLTISAAGAPTATLVFPHVAAGQGISVEINLTNPAPHIEKGHVLFLSDDGTPMALMVDGILTSQADFSVAGGGVKKLRIEATGPKDLQAPPQVGYALVVADNAASSLVGNLVFTISKMFDVSVPDSRSTNSARLFVERNLEVNSGYAVLNRNDHEITLSLLVKDDKGQEIGQAEVKLGPGQKVSKFLEFVEVRDFIGNLEITSEFPFYVMGLRQRRTGSLAVLPAAVSPGPIVGSQLLFFLDTGINLLAGGYSEEELKSKTVYELTGLTKSQNPTQIKITNNNRGQAVTVHVYFLNDKAQDYFDFLLVLRCGETLTFDPFDFEIPVAGLNTSNFLFGYGLPSEIAAGRPAVQFGSGRFLLSVLAVGNPLDPANPNDDILYPNEVALTVCGMTPRNTGKSPGLAASNLHIGNAFALAFDYLSGNHVYAPVGLDGSSFAADEALKTMSVFTRTLVPAPGIAEGFMVLVDPGSSDLIDYMAAKKGPAAGTVVLPSTAVFTWGSAPFTFLPGGR